MKSQITAGTATFALLMAVACVVPTKGAAQDVSIDRWLVSAADASPGQNPLASGGAIEFPDRDLEVGPGPWILVREDGERRFDFSDHVDAGQAALAHTYVRAPADANVQISIETEPCASVAAWVNGQPLVEEGGVREVRLAGGWNTFFAVVDGDVGCPRALSATISDSKAPRHKDERSQVAELRVQASRPPGVRPNYPEGTLRASTPTVAGLSWSPGRNDLDAAVNYSVTAWGRGSAGGAADEEEERDPPTVDLSGDWDLTMYVPTGIQRMIARFEMADDGKLTGELRLDKRDFATAGPGFGRRDGFEGRIRDGWVSGSRFGWTLRVSGRQGGDLVFTGELRDGQLAGTINFAGFREVSSRFEARREGEGGVIEVGTPNPTPGEEVAEVPRAGTSRGPSDPDGRRRQMVALLLGDTPAKASAPPDGSVRLKVAGESLVGAADALVSAIPHHFEGFLPFKKVREAALHPGGVEAEVRWDDGDLKLDGQVAADDLLAAFHAPIALGGLMDAGDGVSTGMFRVPDVLGGFAVRGGAGQWWVDGVEVAEGLLCDPCQRGQELEIRVRMEGSEPARVELTTSGYQGSGAGGPAAVEWLRALDGDNRKYRELTAG